jgi:hypothetical protein
VRLPLQVAESTVATTERAVSYLHQAHAAIDASLPRVSGICNAAASALFNSLANPECRVRQNRQLQAPALDGVEHFAYEIVSSVRTEFSSCSIV